MDLLEVMDVLGVAAAGVALIALVVTAFLVALRARAGVRLASELGANGRSEPARVVPLQGARSTPSRVAA
jgi:hypothetical protein